jgi:Leucine-rich repeat (LRR) protein
LTLLDVSVNPLSDISVLAGLTNLTNLYLNENQISDISPLAGLTNLEALGLNSNQVSDVSVLTHLTKLYELDLRANRISDVSSIAAIYQVIQSSSNPWAYFSAADQKALINVVDTSATVTNPLRRFDGTAIQPNSVDTTYAKYDSGTNQFSLFNLSKAAPTKFADFQFNCARQPSDDPATTVCFSGTLSARYNSNTLTLGGAPKSGVSTANHNAITLSIATLGLGAIALAIVKQRKAHFKK